MIRQTPPPLPAVPGHRVRHVPGRRGYAVGTDGSVWTCVARRNHATGERFTPGWRQLAKSCAGQRRYHAVTLGKGRRFYVHHLVLTAFIGPRPIGRQARHLNGDPWDNHLDNLRWATPRENAADRHRHGTETIGVHNPAARLDEGKVVRIFRMRDAGMTRRAIAAHFGVSQGCVNEVLARRNWAHVWVGEDHQ